MTRYRLWAGNGPFVGRGSHAGHWESWKIKVAAYGDFQKRAKKARVPRSVRVLPCEV